MNEFKSGFSCYHFSSYRPALHITEFGHTVVSSSVQKKIGPYARASYILHFVINETCHFSGFDAHAGNAFLISKKKVHSFTVNGGYEHYWIAFDGEICQTLFNAFQIPLNNHTLFYVQDVPFVSTLLTETFSSMDTNHDVFNENRVISLLLSLLPLLSTEKRLLSDATGPTYAEAAEKFILQNFHRDITIEQVARQVNISEKYLYRLFLKRYHIPPQKYLQKVRMEQAKYLLTKTNLSIKEISISVGYQTQSSFSAAFNHYFDISPSKMRELNK